MRRYVMLGLLVVIVAMAIMAAVPATPARAQEGPRDCFVFVWSPRCHCWVIRWCSCSRFPLWSNFLPYRGR